MDEDFNSESLVRAFYNNPYVAQKIDTAYLNDCVWESFDMKSLGLDLYYKYKGMLHGGREQLPFKFKGVNWHLVGPEDWDKELKNQIIAILIENTDFYEDNYAKIGASYIEIISDLKDTPIWKVILNIQDMNNTIRYLDYDLVVEELTSGMSEAIISVDDESDIPNDSVFIR